MTSILSLLTIASTLGGGDVPFENQCFRVEEAREIRAYDLWHSTQHGPYHSQVGQTLSYWRADPESAAREAGWTFLSVVMAGWGDIGEEPTALVVYVRETSTDNAEFDVDSDGDGAAIALQIRVPAAANCGHSGIDNRVTISVGAEGAYSVSAR